MKQAKDYIIFPLDVPTEEAAKKYVELLSESVGMFKVGLELFIQSGPGLIDFIKASGNADVFLDLKLHDIPETVFRAMERIADLGVKFTTVHCGETLGMLGAAVNGANGRLGVLGVTLLTSVASGDLKGAGFRKIFYEDLKQLVLKRAELAKSAGCVGIVCSGSEVKMIKKTFGRNFLAVTPGIRPAWDGMDTHDQKRVVTPAVAVENGSDFIVIGRPIRDANNPKEAALRIVEEIDAVL
jgi:orotidine-5'-phosphate decarboxylase